MFLIQTEQDLLNAFRPRDRAHLELPKDVKFPLFVRDYLAWTDGPGGRVHLLLKAPGAKLPLGVSLRRDQSGGRPAAMCEFCHWTGGTDQVGLLTADVSSKKRAGLNVCLDLSCRTRLEEAADRAGTSALEASRVLLSRMARFVEEALGMKESMREL